MENFLDRNPEQLSGGEKTKLQLISLFLDESRFPIIDEPTNHLDMESIQWLEEYMAEYEHAVIFVSHDRFFLDQVVSIVYEIENKHLKKYVGNYTSYKKQKQTHGFYFRYKKL